MSQYAFYILSALSVMSALFTVFSKKPVYSVLYLIFFFFTLFGHYILLNAQFLAAVHLIVYAGAIMVLFLFVIMMLNLNKEIEPNKNIVSKFAAVISSGLLLIVIVSVLKHADVQASKLNQHTDIGLVESIGHVLYNEYMLPFEMVSILLLTALIGAVMLGKKEVK
ncbi:MAG TPA: NADH-quinone oxidoreductase subunit J [Bacteroidia bacterium]|nr:NADH-quinone oxidoreductase subunit J [Bacteroidia bacterium]